MHIHISYRSTYHKIFSHMSLEAKIILVNNANFCAIIQIAEIKQSEKKCCKWKKNMDMIIVWMPF